MLSVLLLCTQVVAAPSDDVWLSVERAGKAAEDLAGDAKQADLLGPLLWDVDSERLWFRARLADVSDATEIALVWLNADDVPQVGWRCTTESCSVETVPVDAPLDVTAWSPTASTVEVEVMDEMGHDLAFGVDRSVVESDYGLSDTDAFRVAVFTQVGGVLLDAAFCEGSCALLEMASDPLDMDRDEDGLSTPREAWVGADPDEVDSDGDGLADGDEPQTDEDSDGFYAARDCDSDADGLGDGLESGLETPIRATPKETDCWVADADPSTTTDPAVEDTDGGGLPDGAEDWNANGRWDAPWETSPTDPNDDLDTDKDGIPDVVELEAPDGSIDDEDSDGDGIPDALEGVVDTDTDGWPDFTDTDADGDGLLDADEGTDDTDGDGLPHFRDLDSDGDTWPDAVEGLADSDFDGVPDRLDRDSDNDGIPDAEESGDVDCDGIEDRVDGDHESDFCDTGQPIPGTSDAPWVGPNYPQGDDLEGTWFGGGGCATVRHGGTLFWLVVPLLMFRRTALIAGVAAAGAASAQEVNVDHFRPAPGSSWLVSEDPWISTHRHGLQTVTDLATDVVSLRADDGVVESLVPQLLSTRLVAHSVPIDGVGLGFVVPWHASGWGNSVGDVELSGRATRAVSDNLRAGVMLNTGLATGVQPWLSAAHATVRGGALLGWESGGLRVALSGGVRSGTGARIGRLPIGPSLTWSVATAYEPDVRWRLALEGFGAQGVETNGVRGGGPAEWLLSTALRFPWLSVTAGAGTGMGGGLGVPRWRTVLSVTVGVPAGAPE